MRKNELSLVNSVHNFTVLFVFTLPEREQMLEQQNALCPKPQSCTPVYSSLNRMYTSIPYNQELSSFFVKFAGSV